MLEQGLLQKLFTHKLPKALSTFTLCFSFWNMCLCQPGDSLEWEFRLLTVDANEGIDLADFDSDGKLDVVSGRNWYASPDFTPRPIRIIDDWNGYVLSNGDFAYDVNGDGWMDVIAGAFNLPEVFWYENPGTPALHLGTLWKKHLLMKTESSENEGQLLHDIDADGRPEWVVNSWTVEAPLIAWRFQKDSGSSDKTTEPGITMVPVVIGEKLNGHGLGLGDLNGDGSQDLLFESGWYEAPKTEPFSKPWKLHQDWKLHASLPILVKDLNEDGRADIIIGRGHDYGLYWWEQKTPAPDGTLVWAKHLIDDTFSQPHSLHLADLDEDGTEELIVGKRVRAHNGNDPGGDESPCLYYYTWDSTEQGFKRHTIDEGRIGGGLQIRSGDLNGDGLLDLAVAGKSGTYVLFNQGK